MDSLISNTLNKRLAAYNSEVGIYIFGTGQGGRAVYKYLNSFDYRIKGFFDNNDLMQGTRLEGMDINAPMAVDSDEVVIIASVDYDVEMFKQLVSLGLNNNQIISGRDWLCELIKEDILQQNPDHIFKAAYIDIVDACNLRCATCPRSTILGTGEKMELGLFCKVLDKLQRYTSMIGLYNWSEAFLHPELLSFVKEIKQRSMVCELSSNLALPNIPQLRDVMDALQPEDGDQLIVSITGLKQNIYGINHIGGNIETVKRNIEIASGSRNRKALVVRLIRFDYNQEEEEALVNFCRRLGVSHQIVHGLGDPHKRIQLTNLEKSAPVGCPDVSRLAPCVWLLDSITIDIHGNVTLCCGAPPDQAYIIGSFLEQDIADITIKRYFHFQCALCTMPAVRREFSSKDMRLLRKGLRRVSP